MNDKSSLGTVEGSRGVGERRAKSLACPFRKLVGEGSGSGQSRVLYSFGRRRGCKQE